MRTTLVCLWLRKRTTKGDAVQHIFTKSFRTIYNIISSRNVFWGIRILHNENLGWDFVFSLGILCSCWKHVWEICAVLYGTKKKNQHDADITEADKLFQFTIFNHDYSKFALKFWIKLVISNWLLSIMINVFFLILKDLHNIY